MKAKKSTARAATKKLDVSKATKKQVKAKTRTSVRAGRLSSAVGYG